MNYLALHQKLSRRGVFRIKPGLDRIRIVLSALGQPQNIVPTLHIAGTNGKGSVAASLESVLRQAGFRTGLYTSPHLKDVRERIQINRQPISPAHFSKLAQLVLDEEHRAGITLTYFEFLTAMAFLAFTDAAVDVVVLETGMGGRWDATNVVQKPALTLITSVGLDHIQWLGRTEAAIAREKAGIIKSGVPLICGARGQAAKAIAQQARTLNAPTQFIDQDFHAVADAVEWHDTFQRIVYTSKSGIERTLAMRLMGRYQIDNAAITLAGLGVLIERGWKIGVSSIEQGLANVAWAGRFQSFMSSGRVPIVFDGAHNPSALRELLAALQTSPWEKVPKTFIFGVYRDKDYRRMLNILKPHAHKIILCTLPGTRALPAHSLKRTIGDNKSRLIVIPNPRKALKSALQSTPRDHVIVVTGSLSLVGLLLPEPIPEISPALPLVIPERTAQYA